MVATYRSVAVNCRDFRFIKILLRNSNELACYFSLFLSSFFFFLLFFFGRFFRFIVAIPSTIEIIIFSCTCSSDRKITFHRVYSVTRAFRVKPKTSCFACFLTWDWSFTLFVFFSLLWFVFLFLVLCFFLLARGYESRYPCRYFRIIETHTRGRWLGISNQSDELYSSHVR